MVFGDVGVVHFDKGFDEFLHFLDVACGARFDAWRQDAEFGDIIVELLGGALGNLGDTHAFPRPRVR